MKKCLSVLALLFAARIASAEFASNLVLTTIAPCRLLDTRTDGTPLEQGVSREVHVTGKTCDVPQGAKAASLTITALNIDEAGYTTNGVITVGVPNEVETNQPSVGVDGWPSMSFLNYPWFQGQINNSGIVALGFAGQIILAMHQAAGTADIVIDVNGYFTEAPQSREEGCGGYVSLCVNPGQGNLQMPPCNPAQTLVQIPVSCPESSTRKVVRE